jgi:outer membrane lipoprotein carrier protein
MPIDVKNSSSTVTVVAFMFILLVLPSCLLAKQSNHDHDVTRNQQTKVQVSPIDKFYKQIHRIPVMKAEFSQKVFDESGVLLQQSSGRVGWRRPQQFYWHIDQPFKQSLVCDGQYVWIHTPSIHQVSKHELKQQPASPLVLLSAPLVEIKKSVNVQIQTNRETGEVSYVLLPHDSHSGFSRIEMIFSRGHLQRIRMVDMLQQLTVIRLYHQREGSKKVRFSRRDFAPNFETKSEGGGLSY